MRSAEDAHPRVSVVIPNYNGGNWLRPCLDALSEQEYLDFEVLVVDNGSSDGSVALLRDHYPQVRTLVLAENTGFARAVNVGIDASRGEYIALLNNDTRARPGWLGALVRHLDASPPEVGAIASLMLELDNAHLVDDAGDALSWTGAAQKIGHGQPASKFGEPRDVFSPCAGAALYRRSFLVAMGGLDDVFFAYLEDVDLGLRGRLAGFRYRFEPDAEVLHAGQGTGVARAQYVRWITRNRLLTFAKSVPLPLLLVHLPHLLYGQVYFLCAYRKPIASLAGYLSFCVHLPHVLRERRRIARSRRISPAELEPMLSKQMSEPPLRELLVRKLTRSRS